MPFLLDASHRRRVYLAGCERFSNSRTHLGLGAAPPKEGELDHQKESVDYIGRLRRERNQGRKTIQKRVSTVQPGGRGMFRPGGEERAHSRRDSLQNG